MISKILLTFVIFSFYTLPLFGQVVDSLAGNAFLLFSYYPKSNMETQFMEGYRSHLEWHRQNNDPFPWYGWFVISGDRLGLFIDGTVGISFNAFENRVKPREDAAHFNESTSPYAKPMSRKIFTLNKTLSTAAPLEKWNPSPYVGAYTFKLIPGKEQAFEDVFLKIVESRGRDTIDHSYTLYRQLTGGDLPTYLLMVPLPGLQAYDFPKTVTTLTHMIETLFENPAERKLLNQLSESVNNIYGEIWAYRQDLSYFPSR